MPRGRRALGAAAAVALVCLMAAGAALARTRPRARLLFAGDVMLSRQVRLERERTGREPWDSLAPLLASADWAGANLEGAVGPDSSCAAADPSLCFAMDEDAPARLAAAGFDAVSVENNHAADLGGAGRARTLRALARAGVLGADFEGSPRFVRVGDVTVAIVAVTLVPGSDGRVQAIPSLAVAQRLRLARSLANVVVASVHWGTELQDWPNAAQRMAAEWLVDHGADVVVGHHPHVVQQPECVHGRPVFFSLGNHVFDQRYPQTKEGLVADCEVGGRHVRCGGVRTRAMRGSAVPVVAGRLPEAALAGCAAPVHPSLTYAGWTLRPEAWSPATADSGGVVIEAWRGGELRWRTRRVALVAVSPGVTSGDGRTFLLSLERHRSDMDGEIAVRPHVYELGDDGLVARWRGTALAWPLLDAVVDSAGNVCALHRGDSFVRIDPSTTETRTMRYRWNGFGFSAVRDESGACARTYADGIADD